MNEVARISCVNCHFLVTCDKNGEIPVPATERKRMTAGFDDVVSLEVNMMHSYYCYRGVFLPATTSDEVFRDMKDAQAEGRLDNFATRDYERITSDRGERCFFLPFDSRMSLKAGEEIERRAADRREARRDRMWMSIGVWVAAAALAAFVICEVVKYRWPSGPP